MFDLFGRKRIAKLEADNDRLRTNLINESDQHRVEETKLKNQVEYLVRTIRDMDQEIWNMAQKMDWNAQRPHFVKLQDGMTARKYAENERISTIIRGELIETYRPNEGPKRIGHG